MKVFSNSITFSYSWPEVSTANWRKYGPWNSKSAHVLAVDTLSRTLDPDTGILRTERLITCKQTAPQWLKALLGSTGLEISHMYEASYVDPKNQTVTMVAQNLTWSSLVRMQETVVYSPKKVIGDDSKERIVEGETMFEQDAKVTALCGGWQKIKNNIEDFLLAKFRENAKTGREGFEMVLEMSRRVFAEEKEKERLAAIGKMAA